MERAPPFSAVSHKKNVESMCVKRIKWIEFAHTRQKKSLILLLYSVSKATQKEYVRSMGKIMENFVIHAEHVKVQQKKHLPNF